MYYAGVPSIIQAARHFYIEAVLLELFAVMKVFGWFVANYHLSLIITLTFYSRMSSMNCARVYNYALAQRHAYILNNTYVNRIQEIIIAHRNSLQSHEVHLHRQPWVPVFEVLPPAFKVKKILITRVCGSITRDDSRAHATHSLPVTRKRYHLNNFSGVSCLLVVQPSEFLGEIQ
jgi:hypothetical protein